MPGLHVLSLVAETGLPAPGIFPKDSRGSYFLDKNFTTRCLGAVARRHGQGAGNDMHDE